MKTIIETVTLANGKYTCTGTVDGEAATVEIWPELVDSLTDAKARAYIASRLVASVPATPEPVKAWCGTVNT